MRSPFTALEQNRVPLTAPGADPHTLCAWSSLVLGVQSLGTQRATQGGKAAAGANEPTLGALAGHPELSSPP